MKKIISLVLAVLMISAICVPVFAAASPTDITTETSGTAVVKVDESSLDAAEWYVVQIPADKDIAWGTESVDMNYKVACQLAEGKKLTVTVTGSDSNTMKDTKGGEDTIAYTPAGFDAKDFDAATGVGESATEVTSWVDADPAVKLTIPAANWEGIAVSVYQTTLTYNVALGTV